MLKLNLFSSKGFSLNFLLLFHVFTGFGQESYKVVGNVIDELGDSLEFGNVLLLSKEDSTIVKAAQFWNGKFELYGVESLDFIVKIRALGYKDYFRSESIVANDSGLVDLGTAVLLTDALATVDVLYIVPIFERQIDKLVINVEGTIMSDRGTAYDVLKSAPNVIVKSGGEVQVVGKGDAIIYLDGQRLISLEMLKAISSKEIKQINIIENPSSKYDAEGNAVIEIITRKSDYEGYQGDLYTLISKRTNFLFYHGGNISYRKNKLSMSLAYAHQLGTYHEEDDYLRQIGGSPIIQLENNVQNDIKHKFDAGTMFKTKYGLDSLSSVYFTYIGLIHDYRTNSLNTNLVIQDDLNIGTLNSNSQGTPKSLTNIFTGGYEKKLDTLGSELTISGRYIKFNSRNTTQTNQIVNLGAPQEGFFQNRNFNFINVLSAKIDYTKSFNQKLKLDFGAKESYIFNESGVRFEELIADTWVIDSSLFNEFDYKENILSGYAQMSGTLIKFSYIMGLRYENTLTNGFSTVQNLEVISRKYGNFFPSAQIGYKITPDLVFEASYANRINRPTYQDLDPFVNFIDSLSSFKGNPFLLPSYSHGVELGLVYFEYASIKLGYTKTINPMFLTVDRNLGTNTFSVITKNIESSEAYTIAAVLPYEFPWWTTFNSFGYTFNTFKYLDAGEVITNDKPSFYVSLYNEFRIKKLFNIELTYDYVSPGSQGLFILRPYQSFGFSLARSILKNKVDLRFTVYDLFFTEIETGYSQIGDAYVDYSARTDTKLFQLSITWNFGKLKIGSPDNKRFEGDEQERIKTDD